MFDAQGGASVVATLANAFARVLPEDLALFRHAFMEP